MDNCTNEEQAKVISNKLYDWNLNDRVQLMFYETRASNRDRFYEQRLEWEVLLFA